MADITHIASGSVYSDNGDPIVPGIPAGLQSGDYMVCVVYSRANATHAIAAGGWQNLGTAVHISNIATHTYFGRFWQSGDSAPSITGASNTTIARIHAFSGVDAVTPVDASIVKNEPGGSATNIDIPAITTQTASALILAAASINNDIGDAGNGDMTTGTPDFTEVADDWSTAGNDGTLTVGYYVNASPSEVTGANVTWTVSNNRLSSAIALKPQESASFTRFPAVGSLALTGQAPTVAVSDHRWSAPDAGSASLTGAAPTVGISIIRAPSDAPLSLVGQAPSVSVTQHHVFAPAAAVLQLAGTVPVVVATEHHWVYPAKIDLVAQGTQPVFGISMARAPPEATLQAQGSAPSVLLTDHRTVAPDVAALSLAGQAPAVLVSIKADVGQQTLALTGAAPQVAVTAHHWRQPAEATLSVSGAVPLVSTGDNRVVAPTEGALASQGEAPQVARTEHVWSAVTEGSATLSGSAPSVVLSDNQWSAPDAATLALVGEAPQVTLSVQEEIAVAEGALALTGEAPSVVVTAYVFDVVNGETIFEGYAPTVGVGYTIAVPAGTLLAAGKYPTTGGADYRGHTVTAYQSRQNSTAIAPSGIEDGDIIFLPFGIGGPLVYDPPTVTPPDGFSVEGPWTVTDQNNFRIHHFIFYKKADGESGDYTILHDTYNAQAGCLVIKGGDLPDLQITHHGANQDETYDITAYSLTTVRPRASVTYLAFAWDYWTLDPPSGTTPVFTERQDPYPDSLFYIATGVMDQPGATGDKVIPQQNAWPYHAFLISVETPVETISISVGAGTLGLQGHAPSSVQPHVIAVDAAVITLEAQQVGFAYTGHAWAAPDAASVTLATEAPAVAEQLNFTPDAATLALDGQAVGFAFTASYVVAPDAATVDLLTYAPSTQGVQADITVDAGALSLAGAAPQASQSYAFTVGAGALALSGKTPSEIHSYDGFPPTRVAKYATPWNSSTSPKDITGVVCQTNDILTAYQLNEGSNGVALSNPTVQSGATVSWTKRYEWLTNGYCAACIWTGVVVSGGTATIRFTNASGGYWGAGIVVHRNHGGVGTGGVTSGTTGDALISVDTAAYSDAVIAIGDWNAVNGDGTNRAWNDQNGLPVEEDYYYNSTRYTIYAATYTDLGTAGSKTLGLTLPDGQRFSIVTVEIKGTGGMTYKVVPEGGVSLVTYAPTVGQTYTLYPADAALSLVGHAPSVALSSAALPVDAGATYITGYAPSISVQGVTEVPHAVLALVGAIPAVGGDITIAVAETSLSLAGEAPEPVASDLKAAAPDAGALALTGAAPTVVATLSVEPGFATLELLAFPPTLELSYRFAPDAATLTIEGYAPSLLPSVPEAVLVLTGYAPTVGVSYAVTVASGTLTAEGYAPDLTGAVQAATLALTGAAPVVAVSEHHWTQPEAGAADLTGHAPDLTEGTVIAVATCYVVVAGQDLGLSHGVLVPEGSISVLGEAPSASASENAFQSVQDGSLALSGFAPTITYTENRWIAPDAATLVLSGSVPLTGSADKVPVEERVVALQGQAPSVLVSEGWTVGSGSLALEGVAPVLGFGYVVAAGSLAFEGAAPTVSQGFLIGAGALSLAGEAPAVGYGEHLPVPDHYIVLAGQQPTVLVGRPIDAGALTLQGHAPSAQVSALFSVDSSVLSLAGAAPSVGIGISVPAQVLGLSGQGLTVTYSYVVSGGTLALAGLAPTFTWTDHRAFTPAAALLSLLPQGLSIGQRMEIGAGAASLVPHAPTESHTAHFWSATGEGLATLTGHAPTVAVTAHHFRHPASATLALVPQAVGFQGNDNTLPGHASILFSGFAPLVVLGQAITVPRGTLSLIGLKRFVEEAPDMWLPVEPATALPPDMPAVLPADATIGLPSEKRGASLPGEATELRILK